MSFSTEQIIAISISSLFFLMIILWALYCRMTRKRWKHGTAISTGRNRTELDPDIIAGIQEEELYSKADELQLIDEIRDFVNSTH
jgi:hypothetical protein